MSLTLTAGFQLDISPKITKIALSRTLVARCAHCCTVHVSTYSSSGRGVSSQRKPRLRSLRVRNKSILQSRRTTQIRILATQEIKRVVVFFVHVVVALPVAASASAHQHLLRTASASYLCSHEKERQGIASDMTWKITYASHNIGKSERNLLLFGTSRDVHLPNEAAG